MDLLIDLIISLRLRRHRVRGLPFHQRLLAGLPLSRHRSYTVQEIVQSLYLSLLDKNVGSAHVLYAN